LDIEGHIVTWSPGAARIYLFSEDQAVGKHVSALYFMDEQNGSEPQRELTRSAAMNAANCKDLPGLCAISASVTSAMKNCVTAAHGFGRSL
jgi:hypothetical protein